MNEKNSSLLINSQEAFQKVKESMERFDALPEEEKKRLTEEKQRRLISKLRKNDSERTRFW